MKMNKEDLHDAAQAFEGSLMIMRKDKSGWVFGMSVHPNDAPGAILQAPLGSRYHVVMFRIDDDESIMIPEEVAKGKRAVSVAGQMCRQYSFQEWMCCRHGVEDEPTEELAASLLKTELSIDSRSDLRDDESARHAFRELIIQYRREAG